jgi:hypothetical protein
MDEIFTELELCNFECEAGKLENNVSYQELKEKVREMQKEVERLKERKLSVEGEYPISPIDFD